MSDPDEPERVRRAMGGDATATGLLWREHRRWVAAVLLSHLPPGVELEDLLQEVALTMVARIRKLRDPGSLRPWLRTVATNVARTAARRGRVRARVLRPMAAAGEPVDPAGDLDRRRSRGRERLARVLEVLGAMQPDYREPLVLRAVEGMSQREIAHTLGLPVTTVETRLARGRRMLRRALLPGARGASIQGR